MTKIKTEAWRVCWLKQHVQLPDHSVPFLANRGGMSNGIGVLYSRRCRDKHTLHVTHRDISILL